MKKIKVNLFEGCKPKHEKIIRFLVNNLNYNPMGFVAYQKEDEIYYFGKFIWSAKQELLIPTTTSFPLIPTIKKSKIETKTKKEKIVGRVKRHYKVGICNQCSKVAKFGLRKGWCLNCYRKNTGKSCDNNFSKEGYAFNFIFNMPKRWRLFKVSKIVESFELDEKEKFEQELIEKLGYDLWEKIKVLFEGGLK